MKALIFCIKGKKVLTTQLNITDLFLANHYNPKNPAKNQPNPGSRIANLLSKLYISSRTPFGVPFLLKLKYFFAQIPSEWCL